MHYLVSRLAGQGTSDAHIRLRTLPRNGPFATPATTVYAIRPGRGFDDAVTVPGDDFDGVLVRDGWVVYRCFDTARHQSCLAHLLRRCREIQDDHPAARGLAMCKWSLQDALELRDRRTPGA